MEPAVGVEYVAVSAGIRDPGAGIRRAVVTAGDVLAPHENLAILCDADLDAGDRRADRSLAGLEWMIERDDRRRLGEAVPLDHREAHTPPELLEVGRQRRRAHDE